MTTLAPKLPYTHPFAGGYPRLGGQPLPTDPDAIDYLERVAAADGAAVEVGVAMAVDAFVKGCKADGVWSAIKASCILCGARTISGALVPLAGTAPTPYNFAGGDYSRTTGLAGDGATKYLDSNRASNADGRDDVHQSVYLSSADTRYASAIGMAYIGASNAANTSRLSSGPYANALYVNNRSGSQSISGASASATGLMASSRSSSSDYSVRSSGSDYLKTVASAAPSADNHYVFGDNAAGSPSSITDARLAFYSIGSSLDLAALDTRVSTLVAAIAAAL